MLTAQNNDKTWFFQILKKYDLDYLILNKHTFKYWK